MTFAWPPSLPSVPTSRATRVTSSANEESWSTIAFTVVPIRWNSPLTGCPSILSAIFWERSPWATASMTRATSVVGRTRSSISVLSEVTVSSHAPSAPAVAARSVMRPSRPITRPTRPISLDSASRRSASSLNARLSSTAMPLPRTGSRSRKSPSRAAFSATRSCSSSARETSAGAVPSAFPVPFGPAPFRPPAALARFRAPVDDDDVALPRSTAATVPPEIAMSS